MPDPNVSVEPVDPPLREDTIPQEDRATEKSLSDMREDINNLPLQKEEGAPTEAPQLSSRTSKEATPADATPADAPKEPELPTFDLPKAPKELLFETQKAKDDQPFKSADAEKILNEAVPPTIKGAAAKSFGEAKKSWAGIVEAKDRIIHNLERAQNQAAIDLQKENEKLAKRVADLSSYESVIDYQAGEKFQTEYQTPIQRGEEGLVKYMESAGATPEGIAELKAGIKDDNYLFNAIAVLEKSAPQVASRMRYEVAKLQDLRTRRDMALEDVKKNHEKFIDERRSETTKKSLQFEEGVKTAVSSFVKAVNDDGIPQYPFLVKVKAPDGASPEQIQQAEKYNKFVEENHAALEKAVRSDDPQERTRLAIGYMVAVSQQGMIRQLQEGIKQRDERLRKIAASQAGPQSAGGETLPAKQPEFEGSLSDLAHATFRR